MIRVIPRGDSLMSNDEDNKSSGNEELFKEHQVCQKNIERLDGTIWKTATILSVGSFGSVALVASKELGWPVALILGFLGTVAFRIWWGAAKRMWHLLHVNLMRVKHIEQRLDFLQARYVNHADGSIDLRQEDLGHDSIAADQFKELNAVDPKDPARVLRWGVEKAFKWLPWANMAAWGALAVSLGVKDLSWIRDGRWCSVGALNAAAELAPFLLAFVIVAGGVLLFWRLVGRHEKNDKKNRDRLECRAKRPPGETSRLAEHPGNGRALS
jgi:hypothetical protein